MRARAFVGMALALALATAGPASAKGFIAEADISGPGLGGGVGGGGGIRIEAPDADRMWEAGIMESGKWDTLTAFRMNRGELGPRYTVTYRFEFAFGSGPKRYVAVQDLYPYAEGGPVSYTPPGQQLGEEFAEPLPSGWWQAGPEFRMFLVENGLPSTNPMASSAPAAARPESARETAPVTRSPVLAWLLVGLVGLAALSLAAPPVRRRVLVAVTRVTLR
jgi:hypothetical protein